jgi:hypothetical protein
MKEEALYALIIELIDCGGMLEDAAGKCGHDDELLEWKRIKKKSKKILPKEILEKFKEEQKRIQAEREKRRIEEIQKQEAKKMSLLENDPDLGDFFKSLKKL